MEADSRRTKLLPRKPSDEVTECDTDCVAEFVDAAASREPPVKGLDDVRLASPLDVREHVKLLLSAVGGAMGLCAICLASFMILGLVVFPTADREVPRLNVAFLGNSITFTNDLPRFLQSLSSNKISQNSCLHGSLNFKSLVTHGNGMYVKWQTDNAVMEVIEVEVKDYDDYYAGDDDAGDEKEATTMEHTIYDFGACSFPQLLFGYDSALSRGNSNSFYSDDGKNPCFEDDYYLDYLNAKYEEQKEPLKWDYVILNDQTLYPGIVRRRKRSIRVLKQLYADLFLEAEGQPIPIFMATYGYDKDLYTEDDDGSDDDQTSAALGDIPEFTSRIWYGYTQYAAALKELLPPSQKPIVVPTGIAFLTLWEENYDMWFKMFQDDGFHPSPHATFLLGCCLYATLYHRMPPSQVAWDSDAAVAKLFSQARRFQMPSMGCDKPLPTAAEAAYLASIAERVVLKGHRPSSLLSLADVAAMEAQEDGANN